MKRKLLPAFLLITALSWGNVVLAEKTKTGETKPMSGGSCAMHCRMNMSSARKTKDQQVMKAMKDCMTKCSNPKTHKTAAKDCAATCKKCAEACESKHDKNLTACAQHCRDCAEMCEKAATH